MRYSRFEVFAGVLGAVAILVPVFLAPGANPQAAEIAAQLLLVGVLLSALHWGRNGGFVAALVAIAVYVAMRIVFLQAEGLTADVSVMLVSRAIAYTAVGVVGGEAASRVKYLFAKFDDGSLVDQLTGAYSARYAAAAIASGLGQYDRYGTEFSVVRIAISTAVYAGHSQSSFRQMMRHAAGHMRAEIRMVDDLAAEAPAMFLIMLPGTGSEGAAVVASRVRTSLADAMATATENITASVMTATADAQDMKNLAEVLSPGSTATEQANHGLQRRAQDSEA